MEDRMKETRQDVLQAHFTQSSYDQVGTSFRPNSFLLLSIVAFLNRYPLRGAHLPLVTNLTLLHAYPSFSSYPLTALTGPLRLNQEVQEEKSSRSPENWPKSSKPRLFSDAVYFWTYSSVEGAFSWLLCSSSWSTLGSLRLLLIIQNGQPAKSFKNSVKPVTKFRGFSHIFLTVLQYYQIMELIYDAMIYLRKNFIVFEGHRLLEFEKQ